MDASLSGRLKTASPEVVDEIMREAELYLNAQLTAAIAADARANSFASYLAAAGAIAIGAAYTLDTAKPSQPLLTFISSASGVAILIAAAVALHSARSIEFAFAGNRPAEWKSDLDDGKPLQSSKAEMCAYYDEMINTNRAAMERNSRWFELSRKIVIVTLAPAGLLFFLALIAN